MNRSNKEAYVTPGPQDQGAAGQADAKVSAARGQDAAPSGNGMSGGGESERPTLRSHSGRCFSKGPSPLKLLFIHQAAPMHRPSPGATSLWTYLLRSNFRNKRGTRTS